MRESGAWRALFEKHAPTLEDFWGRRENGPRYEREFTLFGRPGRMTSNEEGVLAALDHSLPLYSRAPTTAHAPFLIHVVVRESPVEPGPPPEELFEVNQYTGYGEWLAIQVGAWGHCQIDLAAGRVWAVLTPELAARPDLVSRYLLNTIFNNLLTGAGFAMMHCTGLLRGDHALLIMAPHNSGKSTTALRLVMAGYRLLSDSQIYLSPDDEALRLYGFPVGRAKLRRDMVPEFPHLHALLEPELVRDETKFSLGLRQLDPALVQEEVVRPSRVELCLLSRNGTPETQVRPASQASVMEAVMQNSIFYDEWPAWERNLTLIERLLARSRWHYLAIGTEAAGIVQAVEQLMA